MQAVAVAVVCASILLSASPALVQFLLCLPWDSLQRLSRGCAPCAGRPAPQTKVLKCTVQGVGTVGTAPNYGNMRTLRR